MENNSDFVEITAILWRISAIRFSITDYYAKMKLLPIVCFTLILAYTSAESHGQDQEEIAAIYQAQVQAEQQTQDQLKILAQQQVQAQQRLQAQLQIKAQQQTRAQPQAQVQPKAQVQTQSKSQAQAPPQPKTQRRQLSLGGFNFEAIVQSFMTTIRNSFAALRSPSTGSPNNLVGNFGRALNVISRAVDWVTGNQRGTIFSFFLNFFK